LRVLVCGGRDYSDAKAAYAVLDKLNSFRKIEGVIQGSARGADLLGKMWALSRRVPCYAFPADWERYGKSAGPIRNQQMLDEGKPDLVIAFPGGRGTADMVRRSKSRGVRVIQISGQGSAPVFKWSSQENA